MATISDVNPIVTDATIADVQFHKPFRMQIVGASGAGKSFFLLRLIRHRLQMISGEDFVRVVYLYGDTSPQTYKYVDELEKELGTKLEPHRGLQSLATDPKHGHVLLIVDDLHPEFYASKEMLDLLNKLSRHLLISVIVTQQCPYPKYAYTGEMDNNWTHRVILDGNDHVRARILSLKLFNMPSALPDILNFLRREFPEEKRAYLLLDGTRRQPAMAYRGMIFPRNGPNGERNMMWPIIFVKKGDELPRKKLRQ